jgi:hypothetical protein
MKLAFFAAGSFAISVNVATAQTAPVLTFADVPLRTENAVTPLRWAWSIAVDRLGNRYVVEWGRHSILKITPAGEVTTFAGRADVSGAEDGRASEARFNATNGSLAVTADDRGNVFVADQVNRTIRKINQEGEVTTIAGTPGATGNTDGVGSSARFNLPSGIAVDHLGYLHVLDGVTIRRISPDGWVSTPLGQPYTRFEGVGTAPGVTSPLAIAVDRERNVYVACYDDTIRRVSPAGEVTILAGRSQSQGFADGKGEDARFHFSHRFITDDIILGLTVDPAGNIWAVDPGNGLIRRITPAGMVTSYGRSAQLAWLSAIAADAAGNLHVLDTGGFSRLVKASVEPMFTVLASPPSQTIARGGTAVFTAAASGTALTYQWKKDGVTLPGATDSSFIVRAAGSGDAGSYAWTITDATGATAAGDASLVVAATEDSGRLVSLSVRSDVGAGSRSLMLGATIAGGAPNDPMPVLLRGVGSSLNRFGGRGYLADPTLTLSRGGIVAAANDDWLGEPQIVARTLEVGAFPLESPNSGDAAIVAALIPGAYVMELAGKGDATGIALGEWFDATPEVQRSASTPRLVNLSARKQLGANGEILTAGFEIGGPTAKTVLLRAVGPSLAAFGVAGALPDPMLQLFAGPTLIREIHDWGGDVQLADISRSVRGFDLASADSKDAALLITLKPGDYTLQVRGQNHEAGFVLAEIFEVP